MKKLIPNSTPLFTLSIAALLLAGCATRPPRRVGPPPEPLMPPMVANTPDSTLPPPLLIDITQPNEVESQPMTDPVSSGRAPQPRKGTSYTIRKGESLSAIAARNKMSWRELADYNYITDPDKVRAGQIILIPNKGSSAPVAAQSTATTPPPANVGSNGSTYVVQPGESLSVIARRYNTSVSSLKSVNGLNSDRLLVGQILKLPEGSSSTVSTEVSPRPTPRPTPVTNRPLPTPIPELDPLEIDPVSINPVEQTDVIIEDPVVSKAFPIVVQEGDTLQSIANNYIVPVEEIRKLNNLPANAEVTPGQKLQIPPSVY